jgi:predicted Zn-dependent protease
MVGKAFCLVLMAVCAIPGILAQPLGHVAATEAATQTVKEILARPHVELEVLLETGTKLAEQELFAPARAIFSRAVTDYPHSFEARYNLALADFALSNFTEAEAVLKGGEHLSKDQQLAREYLQGKIYDAIGRTQLGEQGLAAAFRGSPQQENYALDLGLHYLRLRAYDKAVTTLKTAADYHPDSLYVALGLGLAQVLGDDPPRAVATCRKILAKDANFAPARLLLVAALYMNGENEQCVRETATAIAFPNAHPYLYYLHAASLLKLNSKEYAEMIKDLDAATQGIPGCAFCYFAKSKVHQELGDDAAAIADLETLVSHIDPEFSQGWYRLANLYQHSGRSDDAAGALAKFRAMRTAQTDREAEYLRNVFLDALK